MNKNHKGTNTEAYNKLKEFLKSQKHISLKQINSFLTESGFQYSRETIQKYLQHLKKEDIIFSAGRGYYSTIKNEFVVDDKEFLSLVKSIKEKYPLLDFSLWSTKMIAPYSIICKTHSILLFILIMMH